MVLETLGILPRLVFINDKEVLRLLRRDSERSTQSCLMLYHGATSINPLSASVALI